MLKIAKILFLGVRFYAHVTSIGFATLALFQGNYGEAAQFAVFAYMTA